MHSSGPMGRTMRQKDELFMPIPHIHIHQQNEIKYLNLWQTEKPLGLLLLDIEATGKINKLLFYSSPYLYIMACSGCLHYRLSTWYQQYRHPPPPPPAPIRSPCQYIMACYGCLHSRLSTWYQQCRHTPS